MAKTKSDRKVLVTTQHRGVFYGTLADGSKDTDRSVVLRNCRNAIYWSGKNGFLGLAATGPESGSKIGAVADRIVLHDVTSVTDCTAQAASVWEEWK